MRKTALLVVVLVVLAGCNGLSGPASTPENPQTTATSAGGTTEVTETDTTTEATDTTTTESADRVDVTEQDAELGDVNATAVWQRVAEIVSVDGPNPPPVSVESGTADRTIPASQFLQSFGGEEYTFTWKSAGGRYNPSNGYVELVRTSYTTDENLEAVLAHEFTHVYYDDELEALPENASMFVQHAVHEGAVEYVTWEYADRHTDANREATSRASFRDGRPYTRFFQGGYYLGAKYARNFSDPDRPLASMYENPPTTAEQILHALPPGSEPPRNLSVEGTRSEDSGLTVMDVQRRGEAQLRFVLEYELPRERAAEAAAGWGDDRSIHFQSVDEHAFAWVVRWDSPSEADEFAEAFAEFETNVSEPLALQRVGDETTVVFSGEDVFVENATATGTAGNVTVSA